MRIFIQHCLTGARQADGLTVIIDVFRSSNTILALLASGVRKIIVTGSVSSARLLKRRNPSWVLCGERNRVKLPGFAYGNSPAILHSVSHLLRGKTIILTTSAGAKGIVAASNASEIIIGTFANAASVCSYIQKKKPRVVTLVAIGTNAKKKALEDTLCANFISTLLLRKQCSFQPIQKAILKTQAAKDLRMLGCASDIPLCLQKNTSFLVPKVRKDRKTIFIIR